MASFWKCLVPNIQTAFEDAHAIFSIVKNAQATASAETMPRILGANILFFCKIRHLHEICIGWRLPFRKKWFVCASASSIFAHDKESEQFSVARTLTNWIKTIQMTFDYLSHWKFLDFDINHSQKVQSAITNIAKCLRHGPEIQQSHIALFTIQYKSTKLWANCLPSRFIY